MREIIQQCHPLTTLNREDLIMSILSLCVVVKM